MSPCTLPIAAIAVSILLLLLLTIHPLWQLLRHCRGNNRKISIGYSYVYEHEDGKATHESMAKFSTKKRSVCIVVVTISGVAVSFGQAVYLSVSLRAPKQPPINSGNHRQSWVFASWVLLAGWICLSLQYLSTFAITDIIRRYKSTTRTVLSVFLLGIQAGTLLYLELLEFSIKTSPRTPNHPFITAPNDVVPGALTSVQIIQALIVALLVLNLPRRPDIFDSKGNEVDRGFSTSLISCLTLSHATPLITRSSATTASLSLPSLCTSSRCESLEARFYSYASKASVRDAAALWKVLILQFRWELARQWTLITVLAVADLPPQVAVLKLLQILERRSQPAGSGESYMEWIWVAMLGASMLLATLIEYRCNWMNWRDLAVPVRGVLTSLLFKKLMTMKNGSASLLEVGAARAESSEVSKADQVTQDQTAQSILNLFILDPESTALLLSSSQFYIFFGLKLLLTLLFLFYLLGSLPLLASLSTLLFLLPLNGRLFQSYSRAQKSLVAARDDRSQLLSDLLNPGTIRSIKFAAREAFFTAKVEERRDKELQALWKSRLVKIRMIAGSQSVPVVLTAVSLGTYAYEHGRLTPSVAFTALGVLGQFENLLGNVPILVVLAVNARVSLGRIARFLSIGENAPERKGVQDCEAEDSEGEEVRLRGVDVAFPVLGEQDQREDKRFILRNLNLTFPAGELSVISGPSGSGKSLLLAAILDEAALLAGTISTPKPPPLEIRVDDLATAENWIISGATAAVTQPPWIENTSVKSNILFGLPFDHTRYKEVIYACALGEDLKKLAYGDETEVSGDGANLSGGQRWRVALARAFYSRASLLVIDDVLSALDGKVAQHVYKHALVGRMARGRTRILATHHQSLLEQAAAYEVRLSCKGEVEFAGCAGEEDTGSTIHGLGNWAEEDRGLGDNLVPTTFPQTPVSGEKTAVGGVKWEVYTRYFRAIGILWLSIGVLSIFSAWEMAVLGRTWCVKILTGRHSMAMSDISQNVMPGAEDSTHLHNDRAGSQSLFFSSSDSQSHDLMFYLILYLVISILSIVLTALRFYIVYASFLRATRTIFTRMVRAVMQTPLHWSESVPIGRIMNRFTADCQVLDLQLGDDWANLLSHLFAVIGTSCAAFLVSPYLIILAVLLLALSYIVQACYLRAALPVKRQEATSRSLLLSHLESAKLGLHTVRSFSHAPRYIKQMRSLIDTYGGLTMHHWLFNAWVGIRLSLIGAAFATGVAVFVVLDRGFEPALAGFVLTFVLEYASGLKYTVRLAAAVELDMNAAERALEFCELEPEEKDDCNALLLEPRASWPEKGRVVVDNLRLGYGDTEVLRGVSFIAEGSMRLGIIGRTGAGKSTLALALLRFLNARSGSVTIDGLNISTIPLPILRSRLGIVPQQPVLFPGTIRSNLDPYDEYSDEQLWGVLKRVYLLPEENIGHISSTDGHPSVHRVSRANQNGSGIPNTSATPIYSGSESSATSKLPFGLSTRIPSASGGENATFLSAGQAQLLHLVRFLLAPPKILILDEATSAIDMATDERLQKCIREEFKNTTLIVIAHRLDTVLGFDQVLTLEDGKVVSDTKA